MSIADLIRRMAEAGAPIEAIAMAVEAIEAGGAEIKARRAADAERKARQRAKSQGQSRDSHGTVTGQSADIPIPEVLEVSQTLPNSPTPYPSKKPPKGGQKGSRLSADWTPSDDDRQAARSLGFTDQQAQGEFDKFRDYWVAKPGNGGVKLDWAATLRNWLRSSAERRGIALTHTGSTGPPVQQISTTEEWFDLARRRAGSS